MSSFSSPCDCLCLPCRWAGCFPRFPEDGVQRGKPGVLAGLRGLQEDPLSGQAGLQGSADLRGVHRRAGSSRGGSAGILGRQSIPVGCWDLGSPPSPPRGDGEVRVRKTGMPSCLLQLALLTVTHPVVRATTLTILLVTTSEFASNYNLHFLTTMSFLGVFHPTSLIYYQSPRLLVSFLTGHFV